MTAEEHGTGVRNAARSLTVVAAAVGSVAGGLSEDEKRQRLLSLEREARRSRLAGSFVPGKRRNLMRRPMGAGAARTVIGGRRIARNEMCPCGSGRKYKACCLKRGRVFVRPVKIIDGAAGSGG